jgi:hypothetical protein
MLIPLGWGLVGGLDGIKQALPIAKLSLATPHEIGVWLILMLISMALSALWRSTHNSGGQRNWRVAMIARVGSLVRVKSSKRSREL